MIEDEAFRAAARRRASRAAQSQTVEALARPRSRRSTSASRRAGARAPRRGRRSRSGTGSSPTSTCTRAGRTTARSASTSSLDHAEAEGLGAIAVTDHNVFGGAQEAVERARDRRLVVIPGEEVKTADQGEVIGLFLREEIPRGMSFGDTIAAIRAQGGLVYLPHPFDRMHAIPEPATLHRHLAEIDVFEVYNARLLFEAYNDEALRFARKYNLTPGAGSDAHVLAGVGTGAVRMRALQRPRRVPRLAPRRGGAAPAEVARLPAGAEVGGAGQGTGALTRTSLPGQPVTVANDEIYEKYLQKAITESNALGDELARPAAGRVPVLGSGHPLADVFLLKYAPQASELQEGVAFYGRAGKALLKSLQRLHVDPMAIYGTNCLKFAGGDEEESRPFLLRELHIVQPKLVVAMGEAAVASSTALASRSRASSRGRPGELQELTPTIQALVTPDIDESLDEQPAKTAFWNAFKVLGEWWSETPPY